MKILKAITIGVVNWIIGVTIYSLSYTQPILENPELQGNICLALVLIPLGWLGAKFFYKSNDQVHGILPASILASVAVILDALVTVPMMIIPAGGSYGQFFGDAFFWLLITEYLLVVLLYWRLYVKSSKINENNKPLINNIMKKDRILVIGGTGKTGRKVVERLNKKGVEVRVGSRNATPAFDWQDSSNWDDVLSGMDKVYITFQPDLAVPGALEAIEKLTAKAKSVGVRKLVLLSGKGEKEAELCEQVIIHSGLDYTIVRASWFNQNFSESFFLDPIIAGHVALPKAEAQVPYVDTDDIADVVVAAMTDDKHRNQLYELTGPELLTFKDVINKISSATNRNIQFTSITLPAYVKMLEEHHVPADYVWLINYLFSEVLDKKSNAVITKDIEKVLGRKAKDFSTYVKETASTGVWNVPIEKELA